MDGVVRIAMWSGPRNISTAMMRAWENRADCRVMDEPFYGAYLAATGLQHPMRAEILQSEPSDWRAAERRVRRMTGAPVLYQKHMCQHMVPGAPTGWMADWRHAFLIRPPAEVAASFHRGWPEMGAADLGFARQAELFDAVRERTGAVPPVVEAGDVLADPPGMLRALCAALEVEFDPAMLEWPAGRRDSDGVWAAHWYRRVEASKGFARGGGSERDTMLPTVLADVAAGCRPHYERMRAHRLRPLAG